MTSQGRHVMLTLGLLFEQAREVVIGDPAISLRPSQLRVVGMVPDEGITVTGLFTMQGVGGA